ARNQLEQERRAWGEERDREIQQLEEARRRLDQDAAAQAEAARQLHEQQRQWEARRRELEQEAVGLDQRIHNQRCKLLEQEEGLRRLEASRQQLARAAAHSQPAPTPPAESPPVVAVAADPLRERECRLA